jgi:hypothetical protein
MIHTMTGILAPMRSAMFCALILVMGIQKLGAVSADQPPGKYVAITEKDERATVEICLQVESPGILNPKTVFIYLIPEKLATGMEQKARAAQIQDGEITKSTNTGTVFVLDVKCLADSIAINAFCHRIGSSKEIEREANFDVPYFQNRKTQNAQILCKITWNKLRGN